MERFFQIFFIFSMVIIFICTKLSTYHYCSLKQEKRRGVKIFFRNILSILRLISCITLSTEEIKCSFRKELEMASLDPRASHMGLETHHIISHVYDFNSFKISLAVSYPS